MYKGFPGLDPIELNICGADLKFIYYDYAVSGNWDPILDQSVVFSRYRTMELLGDIAGDEFLALTIVYNEIGIVHDENSTFYESIIYKELHRDNINLSESDNLEIAAIFNGDININSALAEDKISGIFKRYILKNPRKDKYKFYKFFPGHAKNWAEHQLHLTLSTLDDVLN